MNQIWLFRVFRYYGVLLLPFVLLLTFIAFIISQFISGSSLFLIQAETSRLQHTVTSQKNSQIFVENVIVFSNDAYVFQTEKPDASQTPVCYSGTFTPAKGSLVEFSVENGLQTISLRSGPPKTDEDPNPAWGSLSLLQSEISNLTPEFASQIPKKNPFVVQSEQTSTGIAFKNPTTLTTDPRCFPDTGPMISFANSTSPLFIDGPGQIGRRILLFQNEPVSELAVLDTKPVFIQGEIASLSRTKFCLFGGCDRLYATFEEPIKIPPGSRLEASNEPTWLTEKFYSVSNFYYRTIHQLLGGTAHNITLHDPVLRGQAIFDGNLYAVNVSVNAFSLAVTLPIPGLQKYQSDKLSGTLLDQLSNEPAVVNLLSIAAVLLGLIIGVAEVGSADEPTPKKRAPYKKIGSDRRSKRNKRISTAKSRKQR